MFVSLCRKLKSCNNNQKELVYRTVGPFVHIPLFSIETQENIVKKTTFFNKNLEVYIYIYIFVPYYLLKIEQLATFVGQACQDI